MTQDPSSVTNQDGTPIIPEPTPVVMPVVEVPAEPPRRKDTTLEQAFTQNQLDTAKSSTGSFTLPCGYLTPEQPPKLIRDVVVREIKGHEEDMLASKKTSSTRKSTELITRCIQRLGPYVERGQIAYCVPDLLTGDSVFLVLSIRRVTVGDEYPFRERCPACNIERLYTINLADLDVKMMPQPEVRDYSITTPRGLVVKFHPMSVKDEDKIQTLRSAEDVVTLALLARIDSINDQPPQLAQLKNLGMSERNYIRDAFDDVEGGIETEVELDCPACGEPFRRELDIAQSGFFFPSGTRKRSKKTSST